MGTAIEFEQERVKGYWQITSPQVPGWICTTPAKETALAQARVSLRSFLRYADDIDPGVRRRVEALVLG